MKRFLLFLAAMALLAAVSALHYLVRVERFAAFTEPVFIDIPAALRPSTSAAALKPPGSSAMPCSSPRAPAQPRAFPQVGEYRFEGPASPHQIYLRMARGDVYLVDLVIPEGSDAFDTAALVARAGFATEAEFLPLALANEGFLFPSKYRFPRRTTAAEAAKAMKRQFDLVWKEIGGAADPHAAVTLASLVEKEAVLADERRRIAGVFANRLKIGMKLQCDPTVAYAAKLEGRWRGVIYRSDLDRQHPYNTYQTAGLPPGPIANPGRAALEAALRPLDTPELYFVAAPDGSGAHVFSKDLDGHERAVLEYRRGQQNDQKGNGARRGGSAAAGSR